MALIGPMALTAFVAALAIAAQGIRDERHAGFLPIKCPLFYVRCALYAAAGAALLWLGEGVGAFSALGRFSDPSRYVTAFIIGVTLPAILKLSLGTFRIANTDVHLSLSPIVTPIDEALTDGIAAHVDERIVGFIDRYTIRYPDVVAVKATIRANMPDDIDRARRDKFLKKLDRATTSHDALQLYIRLVRKMAFQSVFGIC